MNARWMNWVSTGDWRLPASNCRFQTGNCRLRAPRIGSQHDNTLKSMSSETDNPQSPFGISPWLLVALCVKHDLEETASTLLFDLGSTGIVTLDENADTTTLGGYFSGSANAGDIKQAVDAECARAGWRDALIGVSVSVVPEQDWMLNWKEGFEAVEIGRRLVVAPSWKLPSKNDGRVVIQIDPGMAFGTGTHETTRLCLEAIERSWEGGSLLDVGTGTGILAIAAALLAPDSRVVAIDVDPQAVEVARQNLRINGVSSYIELREGQPRSLGPQEFDVIVANLTAEVIIDLMADLARCLAGDGLMILSGILCELGDDVQRALADAGFKVTERREAGEWCALTATKQYLQQG